MWSRQEGNDPAADGLLEFSPLLDPGDVQSALRLGSRRAARDLMVREMEHIMVGRTPMTTMGWLTEWLQRRRRRPQRRDAVANPTAIDGQRRRASAQPGAVIPPARRRAKRD
jgi:hypothetical protein